MADMSRRQELLLFAETGRLRQAIEMKLSEDAADLLVDVVIRYCSPRRRPRAERPHAR